MAIDHVDTVLRTAPNFTFKMEDFQYRNSTWGKLYMDSLSNARFQGVTVSKIKTLLLLFVLISFRILTIIQA